MVDLDDTSNCPVGANCETCGSTANLAVETATSVVGVMCMTLCRRCASYGDVMPVAPVTAANLVSFHCGHLGITVDDMAEAMSS